MNNIEAIVDENGTVLSLCRKINLTQLGVCKSTYFRGL